MTRTVKSTEHPAHVAGCRSREAAMTGNKDAWLSLFAPDAIIEDPIGPSHFDPEGKGHRGRDEISAFWDKAIAPNKLEFNFVDTFQCGNEEANIGNVVITTGGYQVITEGVFTYKVNHEGKLVALRAYWEVDRAAKTARKLSEET
jgi:steroid Delta-isomerase